MSRRIVALRAFAFSLSFAPAAGGIDTREQRLPTRASIARVLTPSQGIAWRATRHRGAGVVRVTNGRLATGAI